MSLSRRARIGALIGAAVALIATTGGITYAATAATSATSDYAIGCSSAHHALRLINSDGSCPSGYSRINLASAAQPVMLINTTGTRTSKNVNFRGMTFSATCATSDVSWLNLHATESGSVYDVRGGYYLGQGGANAFYYDYGLGGRVVAPGNGPGYVSYTQTTVSADSTLNLGSGELTADLVVVLRTGHTFAVHLYLQQNAASCFVEAQISQST